MLYAESRASWPYPESQAQIIRPGPRQKPKTLRQTGENRPRWGKNKRFCFTA
tara:strand:- start:377 stop:532 length:156 start_codon:yes stop_codon:yes gene_type:complete